MNKAMIIIELVLAPAIIIIIGPKDTLGRLFNIVKYGSITLEINLNLHSIVAIIIPPMVPIKKLIITS